MLYVWRLRFTTPRAWIFILGFFVLLPGMRGDHGAGAAAAGVGVDRGGVLCETMRPISLEYGCMCLLALSLGILQQYLLNGYYREPAAGGVAPRATCR